MSLDRNLTKEKFKVLCLFQEEYQVWVNIYISLFIYNLIIDFIIILLLIKKFNIVIIF